MTTKNTTAYPLQVWSVRIVDANEECVYEEHFGDGSSSDNHTEAALRANQLWAHGAYRAFLPGTPCHQLNGYVMLCCGTEA